MTDKSAFHNRVILTEMNREKLIREAEKRREARKDWVLAVDL